MECSKKIANPTGSEGSGKLMKSQTASQSQSVSLADSSKKLNDV